MCILKQYRRRCTLIILQVCNMQRVRVVEDEIPGAGVCAG